MLDDTDRRILRQWQAAPDLSPAELAVVVDHEQTHRRRRDALRRNAAADGGYRIPYLASRTPHPANRTPQPATAAPVHLQVQVQMLLLQVFLLI